METFDWGRALLRLRHGVRMRRLEWCETMWLEVRNGKFVTLRVGGGVHGHVLYLDDLDATDWVEVPDGG